MKQQLLVLVEWAKYIPAFCELPLDDQVYKRLQNFKKCFLNFAKFVCSFSYICSLFSICDKG